jgi:hypothetical protein
MRLRRMLRLAEFSSCGGTRVACKGVAAGTAAATANINPRNQRRIPCLLTFRGFNFQLQVTRVKRIALVEVARLVAAAEPPNALLGRAVCK